MEILNLILIIAKKVLLVKQDRNYRILDLVIIESKIWTVKKDYEKPQWVKFKKFITYLNKKDFKGTSLIGKTETFTLNLKPN
jgi:hypothetical protein